MKKLFLILWLCCFKTIYSQVPITDTIQAGSWQDAMELTFGLLPKSHYPSNYLLNKANPIAKMSYANGLLNDSSFNMLEFYYIQNALRLAYNNPDSIVGYLYIDSIKNVYIEQNNVLPFGIIDINAQVIKDSAFINGSISVSGYRLNENTSNLTKIYATTKLFCVSPLNMEVLTLNPQFIIKPQFIFSNNSNSILDINVDLDDGLGYRIVTTNTTFQASYNNGGFKQILTRVIYSNGDTLYSRSELNIIDNSLAKALSSIYKPYDEVYVKYITGPTGGGLGTNNKYPTEFTPNAENDRFAEVGIWFGCDNEAKKIRKPFVVFAGYNPKDGKSLSANSNAAWINNSAGGLLALDGWRGPLYETYDGFFTDASKNAGGGQGFGSNGNSLLDKLRKEGYDIIIVRFYDGIGYLQSTAFLTTIVLKDINEKIVSESENVVNPGAALDPEAPGYPFSTKIKKAKHELVVAGYSAGALASRMGLLLMEYEHEKYKCDFSHNSNKALSSLHRTRIWVGVDQETQGSNVPIGQQMFMDFNKSVWFLPANIGDVLNSLSCKIAFDLLETRGVATQNTLYHSHNMYNVGGNTWNVGHHSDFDDYFSNLAAITPANYPANLKGYPKNCYRIAISQGSADGIEQLLASNTNLIYNQSPSSWCVSTMGTAFGIGSSVLKTTPFRESTARVLSSWNNDAFDCKFGLTIKTLFYNWHINIGHWKYHPHNYVQDRYQSNLQLYDIAPASTLPAHLLLQTAFALSFKNPAIAAFTTCNVKDWNLKQSGFSPTVSGLDLHTPGNNTLPRLPNLSLVPGNVSGGLNLMYQNKRTSDVPNNPSPNKDFGFPHLTFPTNHYDYTPYDAIWANKTENTNYDHNTIHVEDPNPLIGEFLEEEIAPKTLYMSNRTIQGESYNCLGKNYKEKYYADFEARYSILAGNQSIYDHDLSNRYNRVRTSPGDFIIDDGAVVTMRANNGDGNSTVTLGAGFSSKHGSIFRAYIYGDTYCSPFSYNSQRTGNGSAPQPQTKEPRPIVTKRENSQKLTDPNAKINIALYPNPSNGEVNYVILKDAEYNYTITDITGKILLTGILKDTINTINLANYDKGVYLIIVSNKEYTQTDRIILQ